MNSAGNLVASVLSGSWRHSPPDINLSAEDLNRAAPLLLVSGAGPLAWWRIRNSDLKTTQAGMELQQAYRFYALQAARHESTLRNVLVILRSAQLEPVLIKGWAVAQFYPEKGLRTYEDVDLCFLPDQYQKAKSLLADPDKWDAVDLHEGFDKLDDQNADELYDRRQRLNLDNIEVSVLKLEDHIRILCLHLLRHGAWRPVWLCDIAALIESRPADFDWGLCFGKDKRQADWIACTIGLAHQLLNLRVDDTPVERRAKNLPGWLVPHVLKQWDAPYPKLQPQVRYNRPMATYLRHPVGLLKALRTRWPDPIESTIRLRGPLNEMPRLPFQLGYTIYRIVKFLAQLPRSFREQQ